MDIPEGLRERKRQRTRQTIARAALELFVRHGFHATTIPQIAEAADVSPRTVSGYFPHKIDLAFPDVDADLASLEARLRDREPGETATAALRAWIRSWIEAGDELRDERRARSRVIRSDADLRAHEHRSMLRAQQAFAAAIAEDLGVGADHLEPRMAAAATFTVFDLLGEEGHSRDQAAALEVIDLALQFIDGGIDALRGSDAAGDRDLRERPGRRGRRPRQSDGDLAG